MNESAKYIANVLKKCLNRKQKLFFNEIKGFKNKFLVLSKVIEGK